MDPECSGDIVLATMVLHNIAIMNSDYFEALQPGQPPLLARNDVGPNENKEGQRIRNYLIRNHFT